MPKVKRTRRPKGDGGVYQRKSDGMWVATAEAGWRDGKRRRLVAYGKREATARKNLQKKLDQYRALGDVDAAMLTGRWLTHWLEDIAAPRNRPRTIESYRSIVNRHLIPALGKYRLDQLAPQHVRTMLRDLEREHSPSMVVKVRQVLKKALGDAEREGLAVRNVAKLAAGPARVAIRSRGAFTPDQAMTLLRAIARHDDASRFVFALMLGPRPGEALGLQIDRVDLDAGVARIDRQLQRLPFRHGCAGKCGRTRAGSCPQRQLAIPAGFVAEQLDGGLCLTMPKSLAGERTAPLPAALVELLRAQIARQAGRPNPHGLVWTRPDGRPVDAKEDRAAWAALVAEAGLPPLDLYSARHTVITHLIHEGTDVKAVGELVGHTDPRTTRGYQHVDGEVIRKAIDRHAAALTPTD